MKIATKTMPSTASTKTKSKAPKPSAAPSGQKAKTDGKTKAKLGTVKPSAAKSPPLAAPAKAKPAAKPVAKPVAKPTAKPVAKKPTKTQAVAAPKPSAATHSSRTAAPQPFKAAPVPKTDQASPEKSMSVTQVESVKTPVEPSPISTSPVPEQLVRASRPSARLAQITVPSLPPAVASTAAKSSFMPHTAPAAAPFVFAPLKKDPKLANNWKSKKVAELSDAEILAMSDDAYMNDTQLAFFRLKLSLLKQDILASAGLTTEHLREDTVVVPDPADRATIEEEHALELRTRDRERKLLKKIEQSIQRIDAGDYGFCDETGEAIGVGRLLARPTATLSLEAQQRRELKQKMFGD